MDNIFTPHPQQPQFPLRELDQAIEALIEFRNAFDDHGEPAEDDDPAEHDGTDQGDPAWIEWTAMRDPQKRGPNLIGGRSNEDDEEDDVGEDDDPAGGNVTDEPHDPYSEDGL